MACVVSPDAPVLFVIPPMWLLSIERQKHGDTILLCMRCFCFLKRREDGHSSSLLQVSASLFSGANDHVCDILGQTACPSVFFCQSTVARCIHLVVSEPPGIYGARLGLTCHISHVRPQGLRLPRYLLTYIPMHLIRLIIYTPLTQTSMGYCLVPCSAPRLCDLCNVETGTL